MNLTNNSNNVQKGLFVPTKILENGIMSPTSEAWLCFTQQKFSANLQAYMTNYVISISGPYSIYS